MKKAFIILILVGLINSCDEKIPDDAAKNTFFGSVNGIVLNEYSQPIENAVLELADKTTKTNIDGRFSFNNLKTGEYTISAFKDLFLTEIQSIEIFKDSVLNIIFELESGEPYLEVSDSIFSVKSNDGFVDISVKSNSDWQINNKSSWIKVSNSKGGGNSNIRLSWDNNLTSNEIRSDSVLITTGNQKKYLKVTQSCPIIIKEIKGIIGNKVNGVADSVLIVFNQPIKVNSIKSNFDLCISDISYSRHNNDNNTVRFSYACAELGNAYPFTISVANYDSEVFVENIIVPFYETFTEIEGVLIDFKLSEDEKYFWVTTYSPDRLYCVDIKDNSIKSAFELDFVPGKLAYNTYNDYLYVLPEYRKYIDIFSSSIYVINPKNGNIVKQIIIEQDEYDHPQRPYVHPHDIIFSSDGLGAVVLKNPGTTGDKWQIIESYDNDKMSYHFDYLNPGDESRMYNFDYLFLDYNHNIIAVRDNENTFSYITKDKRKIFTVDYKFRSDEFYAGGNCAINRFHKLENKYYTASAPGSQCIINLDTDVYSNVLFVESRGATADFSYRDGDTNIVFQEAEMGGGINLFHVLDFNKNKVVMICDKMYDLKNITSLTDGNTLIMSKVDYNKFTTRFYKFNTDDFFRHVH